MGFSESLVRFRIVEFRALISCLRSVFTIVLRGMVLGRWRICTNPGLWYKGSIRFKVIRCLTIIRIGLLSMFYIGCQGEIQDEPLRIKHSDAWPQGFKSACYLCRMGSGVILQYKATSS